MFKLLRISPLVIAALCLLGISTTVSAKNPSQVEVVNTPNVNVVNLPAVQEVTGSVEVSNTPDVNVANTPDVYVINGHPFEVIISKQEPYWDTLSHYNDPLEGVARSYHVVPSGKRLHIEHFSMSFLADYGAVPKCSVKVREDDGPTTKGFGSHHLVMTYQGAFPGGDSWATSGPISLTADDGQYILTSCSTAGTGSIAYVSGSITGYLVDLPPTRAD